MTRIKIPECSNPFEVTVNGRKYSYEAGIETDVPDEVAVIIEKHNKAHYKEAPKTVAPFSGGAPSWNDLKHRPFYEEVSYIPMVEEQTVTFTDNGNSTKAIATLEGDYLSWGETYVLSFDGAEYTFTVDEGSDEEWGTFKIGDVYVDVYTDLRIRIGSISYIGEHTVSVTKIISNVKKLDDKFLPLPEFNFPYSGFLAFDYVNGVCSRGLLRPTLIYKKYDNSEIVTITSYDDMDFSVYNITKLAFDFGIISKDITLVINSTESFNISKGTVCMLFFGKVVIIIYDDNVRVVTPNNPITMVRSITFRYTDNTPVNTSSITIYAQ